MIYERPCEECRAVTLVCFGRLHVMPGQPERWCCDLCISEQEDREERASDEQGGPLFAVEGWL